MIDLNTEEMMDVRRFAGNLLTLLMQHEGCWTFGIYNGGLQVHWTLVIPVEGISPVACVRSCRYRLPFIEILLGRSVEAAAAAILQMVEQSEAEPDDDWDDDDDWDEDEDCLGCQCDKSPGSGQVCDECIFDGFWTDGVWIETDDLDEEDDDEDGD
jgi:hypothetical protein